MSDSQEIKDLVYKIEEDEETGHRDYFLNDAPWTFVDPKEVSVGSVVYFDPNGEERFGIVTGIRESDFIYYDVGFNDSMNIEEVAMFQVYRVENLVQSEG
jgi:hypothetical protein